MNRWYQIPDISDTRYFWDPIFLRPNISETQYFWDPIFLRPDISENRYFWDPIFLRPDISETRYFWVPIFLMLIFLSILGYFRQFKTISEVFVTFLMDIFGYFENIKFTLGAEVLSTFCSCLSYRLQISHGSSYGLSQQSTNVNKSKKCSKL